MSIKRVIDLKAVPDGLLSRLESRDVALWIADLPKDASTQPAWIDFLGLPWRLILSESYDQKLLGALEATNNFSDPMARRRGFIHVIDSDPSHVELPQRCLPVYLLHGRPSASASEFEHRLRRITMLEALRRSAVREILVVAGDGAPVPKDLRELWLSGFRCQITIVSNTSEAHDSLARWLDSTEGINAANLLNLPPSELVAAVLARYTAIYPEERRIIRVRDVRGETHAVDITEADEPERPISEFYSVIEERDLALVTANELSEEEFIAFFRDSTSAWRPYGAGLPWIRDRQSFENLASQLKKLNTVGPEENCIAYITAESGAGGTTLARAMAWECARQGYPVLIAKQLPFVPDALPVSNFLNRVRNIIETKTGEAGSTSQDHEREAEARLYETPWIIVFDTLHWQYRDGELARFRNEMQKSGRPVCLLVVTGPALGVSYLNESVFRKVAELNHAIDLSSARELGGHLNQFLKVYGKQREAWQWDRFYEEHTVRYLEGLAAFWVALSFWIQGEYDLSESIQEWMYRSFKQNVTERTVQEAILRIAAMSSERLPLPEPLLPKSTSEWPISQLLGDSSSKLAALGLVRISSDGERHWALVHDILGRFLINAFFYDFGLRDQLGFGAARDAEHLRFLILRQISQERALGERAYQAVGEDFATSIFKVDPDHGHGAFVSIWREVMNALDEMPASLRDTSRLFRHHTAVSRRRIAKLDERFFDVTNDERTALLNRAIDDIEYALDFIDYRPGAESNLNLLNSLANAYFDLADVESRQGATNEQITELRRLANEATRRAYAENPTNSFVIETYVKDLLQSARNSPGTAAEQCVEALGILYSALSSNERAYRMSQLGSLADQALAILLQYSPSSVEEKTPTNPIEVLVQAWKALAQGDHEPGMALSDIPDANRHRALEVLAHPAGRGNLQVIRLTYDLTSVTSPHSYKRQLELVEQLQASDYRMAPQLSLEYAILLFQNGRAQEGEKVFKVLRRRWRESELFVQIPERLRWLRAPDGRTLQVIHAVITTDYGSRAFARVHDFGSNSVPVPFRPEEHGIRNLKVGTRLSCHVSFGHNGPFLRPVTAGSTENSGGKRG